MNGGREYRLRIRIDEQSHQIELLERKVKRLRTKNNQHRSALSLARRQRDEWRQKTRELMFEISPHRAREAKRRLRAVA